jgi:formylglycine-generating enzyme required for sulfatase activity
MAYPVHTVTVSAFAMDKWEVSIELWESVRAWGNTHGYDLVAGGSFGVKHPVYNVNWWDVVKWNNARSEKEGKVPAYYEDVAMTQVYRGGEKAPGGVKWDAGYRLPTEAEWEKAARGGVAGKLYPWGTDEISPGLAN